MNMLQRLFSTFLLVFCLFAINLSYAQTVPGQMSYQGKLNDADGIPYSGSIDIQFVITATSNANVQQTWSQTQTLQVVNGLYSATLGETGNFIPTEIFTKNNPTLSIFIGGVELLPSISLLSVPYSFYAEHVGTLADDMVETQHILDGTIKLEDLETDIINQNTLLYMTPAGELRWRDADEFVRTDQLPTLQESTVANNGLTLTGTAVRLGGPLTQDTNIDLATNSSSLTFTTTTGNIVFSSSGDFSLPLGVEVNNIVTFISAAATDRQIPTAEAVADAIALGISASPTTATNGLSIFNTNEVGLGGSLIQNTFIDGATHDFVFKNANNLTLGANLNFNLETAEGDVNIIASGTSAGVGDVHIDARNSINMNTNGADILMNAGGNSSLSAKNTTIEGLTGLNLITNTGGINMSAGAGIDISTVSGNVNIDAATKVNISSVNGTEVSAGTFGLNNFIDVNVDEILTAINGDNDDKLITEGAVLDYVAEEVSKAGSGLSQNGQSIDLGGFLTTGADIDGNGSELFNLHNVTSLDLQSNGNIDINASGGTGSNVNINGEGVDISSLNGTQITAGSFALPNGTTVNNIVTTFDGANIEDDLATEGAVLDLVSGLAGSGLTFNGTSIDLGGALTGDAIIAGAGNNFAVNAVADLELASAGDVDIDGQTINIDANSGVNITTVSTGADVNITAGQNIILSAAGSTQITGGTFGLPTGVAVDEILTAINGDNDDKLITEGAVLDYVAEEISKAGSGLSQNGQSIDLGGNLTAPTTIKTEDLGANPQDLTIDGTGDFNVVTNQVDITSINENLNLNAGNNKDVTIIGDGSVNINATNNNVIISSTNGTQITAGTFALNSVGVENATVNEIVSVINGTSNAQLVTEVGIVDFVNANTSTAGSGMTQNGQNIDLGGALTANATISGAFALDIDDATTTNINSDVLNLGNLATDAISIQGVTQITSGTFALNNTTTTDEITINIVGDDNTNLVTEGAVFNFVSATLNGLAGSGLTFNGTNIDLGGSLTTSTLIAANNHAFTIATASNIFLIASDGILSSAIDVQFTASDNIGFTAVDDVSIDAGNINLDASSGTQVRTGAFGLNNFIDVSVDAIVTVLDGLNIENDLVTEAAVVDLVSGLAGSGLTLNTATLAIDLGGVLTTATFIDTNGEDLILLGSGRFGVDVNQILIQSANELDLTSINNNVFVQGSGVIVEAINQNIDISSQNGDIFTQASGDIVLDSFMGDIGVFSQTGDIDLTAQTVHVSSGTFTLFSGTDVNNIATALVSGSNDNDNTLLTANAIRNAIFSTAVFPDNGLTYIGGGQNIGLGGTLTSATTIIDIIGNDLLINDSNTTPTGFFGVNVGDIGLIAEGNSFFSINTGDLTLESNFGNVIIDAVETQVIAGTFALSTGASVDDIATVLDAATNNDNTLLTAKAVADLVSGNSLSPDNGLSITSGTQGIGLGGVLSYVNTIIDTDGNTLEIIDTSGGGRFEVNVDDIGLISSASLDLTSTNGDIFVSSRGDINLLSDDSNVFVQSSGRVDLTSINDEIRVFSQTDDITLVSSGTRIDASNNIDLISQVGNIALETGAGEVFIEHYGAITGMEQALTLNRYAASGLGANGIGEEIAFHIEDDGGNMRRAASLEVSLIDVANHHSQVQLNMLNSNSPIKALVLNGERNSVALGANADVNADGSVAIGVDATVNRNNAVVLGNSGNITAHVGIGTDSPQSKLHVRGDISASASAVTGKNNHVMLLENVNTNPTDVNGLAISLGVSTGTVVNTSNNFVTFYAKNAGLDVAIGAIELGVNSSMSYSSSGADYAEWLERKEITEKIDAADIVGIFGGQITKNTENAQQFRVVSTAPIVLGNRPLGENSKEAYEKIAFLGQVPVKVKGAVQTGDYIIPSGKNDGVGIAVSAQNITASQFAQVIGMAWETSDKQGVKKINVAIGLDTPQKAIARLMENSKKQENLIQELQKELTALRNQNTEVKSDNVELKAQAEKMDKMQSQIDLMMQMMKAGQQKETLNAEDDK
jgi:uncharacterized protein (DUF2345 family)